MSNINHYSHFLQEYKQEKCFHTQSSAASEGNTVITENQAVSVAFILHHNHHKQSNMKVYTHKSSWKTCGGNYFKTHIFLWFNIFVKIAVNTDFLIHLYYMHFSELIKNTDFFQSLLHICHRFYTFIRQMTFIQFCPTRWTKLVLCLFESVPEVFL